MFVRKSGLVSFPAARSTGTGSPRGIVHKTSRREDRDASEGIEREPDKPSDQTRRKHLSFLRSVFSWAEERPKVSGIRRSPFHALTSAQRREYFPKSRPRAFIFKPEQLTKLYALAMAR